MIRLEPISPENSEAVIALQAAPEQAVGFAMYCLDRADGEYWIWRLMVDRDCQRKGFGEAILHGVLQRIMADLSLHQVYISFEPDNHAARA